jgi:hypothetical protein
MAFFWRAEEKPYGGKRDLLSDDRKWGYEEPEKRQGKKKVKEERKPVFQKPVSREERKPEEGKREGEEKYGEYFCLSRLRLRGNIVDFV